MFCVNVKSKEFKEACSRLNIHPSSLEVIVFQYLNNIDAESFPSDEYIMSKLEGKAMTDASESQILLWEKAYSTPKTFSDRDSLEAFIKEASKYFSPDSISIHRNNEGQYVARVTKPENRAAYEKELKRILDNAPRNEQGQLLAPNGKPTKLSERQYAQVRTKAFKEWFGDWTKITQNEDATWNIPNDVSKVIDPETGEPMVVYHHTDNPNLTEFSTDFPNYFSQSKGGTKKAIFFDENPSGTLERKYDIPVFLNIRNLTTYVGTKEDLHKKGTDYTAVVNESAARDERFGGLHMSKFDDNRLLNQEVWIIHDANNVKSATNNVGTFSTESDDIMYSYDPSSRSSVSFNTRERVRNHYLRTVSTSVERSIQTIEALQKVFSNIRISTADSNMSDANGFSAMEDAQKLAAQARLKYGNLAEVRVIEKKGYIELQITPKSKEELEKFYTNRVYEYIRNLSNEDILNELLTIESDYYDDLAYHIKAKDIPVVKEQIAKKNANITAQEIEEAIDFLVSLENNPETNLYVNTCIKWLKNGVIRLPQDNDAILAIFKMAREEGFDVQKLKHPFDVIRLKIEKNKKSIIPGKATNPREIPQFSYSRSIETEEGIIEVYDVEDSYEGQAAVCQALADASPKGEDGSWILGDFSSPWCLSTFNYDKNTGKATPTHGAVHTFWPRYDKGKRQIAFHNGMPVGFNSTDKIDYGDEWWDYWDSPKTYLDASNITSRNRINNEMQPISESLMKTNLGFANVYIDAGGEVYNISYNQGNYSFVFINNQGHIPNIRVPFSIFSPSSSFNCHVAIFNSTGEIEITYKRKRIHIAIPQSRVEEIRKLSKLLMSKHEEFKEIKKTLENKCKPFAERLLPIPSELLNEIMTFSEEAQGEVDDIIKKLKKESEIILNDVENYIIEEERKKEEEARIVSPDIAEAVLESLEDLEEGYIEPREPMYVEPENRDTRVTPEEYATHTEEMDPIEENILNSTTEKINKKSKYRRFTPKILQRILQSIKDIDYKSSYNRHYQETVNQDLEAKLKDILKHYHFEVLETSMREVFGDDILGATDFLNKVIYLAERGDRNAITGVEEFAHAFVKMMGSIYHKPENRERFPETKIYSEIRDEIGNTSLYQQVLERYSSDPQYQHEDGSPNLPKIKEEAIGQALAAVLLDRYEAKNRKDKSFFDKIKQWFRDILTKFKAIFVNSAYLDKQLMSIADSILDGTYHKKFLQKVNDGNYKLQNYTETIENSVAEDGGLSLSIMQDAVACGGIITGSLSYRMQTPVYRAEEDSLHDIDIVFPLSTHGWHNRHPFFRNPNTVREGRMRSMEEMLEEVNSTEPIRRFKERQPNTTLMYAYWGDKDILVVNAIISENEALKERFMSLTGNFASRLEHFTAEEREQIKLVDFFFDPNNKVSEDTIQDERFDLKLANYRHSFKAKLKYGRAKDLYDYQTLNPVNRRYIIDNPNIADRQLMWQKKLETLDSTESNNPETEESSTGAVSKTIDEQYMEGSTALISQIEDLGNIGLSPSEIKHLGEQLMWWISDHLTWLQNNPSKLEETYGIKGKDASLMSREELTSLITPSQLMTKCVEAFTKRQFKSLSQKSKVRKIANNWRALMFLSAKTFADIEGFGIIDSAAGFNVLQKIQTLTEDYNNDNDIDSITETVGDIQEHWQVEFRTIDVMNTMTPEVRLALLQCYVLDKESNPVISEFGIKERIKPRQAVNTILRIAQGQITVEGIVNKLKENRDQYPWFDQLIARLEDQSGANSNFKSAFFSTFCKPFVAYSVVRKNPSTGNYESVIVNEFPALREAMNTITTQYKMMQHPMLGDTLNMDTFNAVKDIYTSLKDVKFADVNVEELVDKLTYIYNAIGYYVTPDLVSNIITESNYKTIVENLGYIINNLTEGYTNDNGTYDPFKFGRGNKNIITSTRAIIKIITDTLEDTALSSTFDNGKMYQSYVTPSYLTKLMQKFTILSEEEFKKFMQEEYGQYKGWFTDSKGEYRLSWLRDLSSHPEMRAIFKHKVQLNFNKHNYMRNMTDAEYTLSVISEFFAESDKAIGNYNVAWYRVPMMSNKPSSEFIRFIAHKGSFYKDTITDNMHDIFLQELSRIQTVRMRNKGKKDIDFIKNFDTNGAKFCFLDFFNEYLNGSQKTSTFGKIINKKLEGKELTEEEKSILIEESKKIIKGHMEAKAKGIIQEWKDQGIVAQCSKIKGINSNNIESELENFIWNDTLASMNIIQMTVTDIAYYKDAEDLQKRFAQIHSPGVRGNNDARDFSNNKVTDGYHRTIYLADFGGVISNVIENITIVFDRKIKEAEDAGRTTEAESLKALKESLVGEKGAYRDINVTDAQGYCCATSYRKKAFIFGKWNKAKEEVYNKLMQGDYTATDLEIAFQPLKPFVYSQIPKSSGVADAPMGKLKNPIQNKNSEYLLLLAGAILQNEDTGKPNLLRAINEVMEESAEKSPTMGIDTIQFASAVKSSLTGVIDINDATDVEEAKERIRKAIYPDYKGDWKSYTPKVDYDERTVHKIPVEDYCIQQEVPPHFRDHNQAHGSQTRAIIIADLADGNYVIREGKTTRTVKKEEFIKEYEKTIAANIEEDINALAEELHLVGSSPAERNIAISRILQREILSNPNRYGTDLLVACSVDSNGNFRIPLGDPVQAKRVEQLINSIVKNRISKQKLPGGPVVQVSNFGTSRQLSIVFKGKDGKPLRKRAKGESEASYKEYLQENQAGIAYMECFAPAYTLDLFKNFMDENGNVDIEAIEATDPELLKMVGYRIPTEDKYSIAPLKIVGFLPKEAGDGIMLPYDITLINGSDFDIDKMYLMRKTLPIRAKKGEEFTHHLQNAVFNKFISKAKQEGRGYNVEKIKEEAWEKVNIFFDKKLTTEEKKEKLGEYYTILSKAYRKYRYETITPTRDRNIRNNKILDMTYEVMTHETTADKMLNPGGFDQQKKMGYAVEAFRNLYRENMSESEVLKLWEELQSKSIDELKELSYKDKNLCFIDTHIQFYKQNAAAGTLIGVFAVHKVAHAILGNDGFRYNGIESPFTIAGNTISGGISIDPERDFTGQYIGKVLGSLVASAADAVKDPILNLMNINNNTATVLCTMVRLGIPFDTAAMFLSQKSIAEILQKHAKESLDSPTSLNEVIKKELKAIESEDTITANSEINTSELTKEELVVGLVTDNKAVKYKVLKMLSSLLDISKDVKSLSYPTRFNSISNAVGPLIIDNLMMEYKLKKFPETITSRDGDKITLEGFLARHPMLKQFHRTVKMASHIFHDMPANSLNFRDLLSNLPKNLKSRITSDRKLLSMLSDFYQSYMLISSEAINSSKLMWYIDKYPAEFIKLLKEDESLKSNPLCAAIRLDVAKQSGRPILKIDTTGVDSDYKESLMSGWADLVKTHPNVAKDLFIYNFFRGGIVFNPQTFMGLVPYQVKENIEGYNESYSNPTRIEPYIVIDQFIRNYSSNNQIVPTVKSLEGLNKLDKPVKVGDAVTIENSKDLEAIGESTYFKVKSGNSYILFKVTSSSKYSKVITRIAPLGNNGEYLELSTDEIRNSAEITALTDSTEEVDNGIGVINGSDTEVEETITINDVTYTDESFTQFWSGKSETESKVFTKNLKGQSVAYLSRIVSILESKGIKVTEEMQNKIKELYNLTC